MEYGATLRDRHPYPQELLLHLGRPMLRLSPCRAHVGGILGSNPQNESIHLLVYVGGFLGSNPEMNRFMLYTCTKKPKFYGKSPKIQAPKFLDMSMFLGAVSCQKV